MKRFIIIALLICPLNAVFMLLKNYIYLNDLLLCSQRPFRVPFPVENPVDLPLRELLKFL